MSFSVLLLFEIRLGRNLDTGAAKLSSPTGKRQAFRVFGFMASARMKRTPYTRSLPGRASRHALL
jgi:hypothetical protein